MSTGTMFTIEKRRAREVNNDPQRRCYNGCHFSTEIVWSGWEMLVCAVPAEKVEARLEFWRGMTAYAVSQRGASADAEYRAVEEATSC
jgi:hypothetical protein